MVWPPPPFMGLMLESGQWIEYPLRADVHSQLGFDVSLPTLMQM